MSGTTVTRAELHIGDRRLSYLDFGGPGRPLLALHGHLGEAANWQGLAAELAPRWRVVAPDQRGHGDSDRADDYTREGYLADAVALLDHLRLDAVVALGHSGGGMTAYQLAARHPERVDALVVEEAAAALPEGPSPLEFVLGLPYRAATREQLLDALGPVLAPLFGDLLRPTPDGGWRLPFHPRDTVASERLGRGDHWADWTGSTCPALLVAGTEQPCLDPEMTGGMVRRRPGTRLVELATDHFVHAKDPAGFAAAVREFLENPPRIR
ncbi:alpha/beta hydrolase [Actinosynnema sp. NPDC023658]|uniref:alpha/beta fold hydrolase n=1 Tax=Actinosynnema sp. NPDC023658 TaxID=3155465 RepID=UPI0033DD11E2